MFLVVNEKVVLHGNPEHVFKKCITWLNERGAKIFEENQYSVKAVHEGSQRLQGIWFAKKYMVIELKEHLRETSVHVKLLSDDDFALTSKRDYWIDFIVDLWLYLGVDVNETLLRSYYPINTLNERIKHRNRSYIPLIFIIVIIYSYLIFCTSVNLIELFVFTFLSLFLILLLSIPNVYKNRQNPWKLKQLLYPESKEKGNRFVINILSKIK